jgi:hypothetical protein
MFFDECRPGPQLDEEYAAEIADGYYGIHAEHVLETCLLALVRVLLLRSKKKTLPGASEE